MIRTILNAVGIIVADAIDEWATKVTRENLLDTIDGLTDRIRYLEDELDLSVQYNAQLQSELLEVEQRLADAFQERDAARGNDPDPRNPYGKDIRSEKYPDDQHWDGDSGWESEICGACGERNHIGVCDVMMTRSTPGAITDSCTRCRRPYVRCVCS